MSLFGNVKSSIKPVKANIRTERVVAGTRPTSRPSHLSLQSGPIRGLRDSDRPTKSVPHLKRSSATPHRLDVPSRRKRLRTKSPGESKPNFGLDSDDEDDALSLSSAGSNKRQKTEPLTPPGDSNRKLKSKRAFLQGHSGQISFIHAADLVSLDSKTPPDLRTDDVIVELQYPSIFPRERYELVDRKDKINSIDEICEIVKTVAQVYLTEEQKPPFTDENTGFIRNIQKARNHLAKSKQSRQDQGLMERFKNAVISYNEALKSLVNEGAIAKNLDSKYQLPLDMVHIILGQVYDRAVSPEVDLLKAYDNGTDNVYGELRHPFVSKILKETKINSEQIFVDLGSGVGNVVLQAALEVGCQSWGCEMMKNAYTLADRQKEEFQARCCLWGIRPGRVHLEKGDFLENDNIKSVLKKADVILVNNQAFTTELNEKLKWLFLDVKDGCQIVSLRPFLAPGHQIAERNQNDPINNFWAEEGSYYSKSVSWTDAGGKYYRTTKDEKRLQNFLKSLSSK